VIRLLALALLLATPAIAGNAPRHGDVGTTMFLLDPPAVPLIASGRANPCVVVNVQENVHMGHGTTATWVFRLACRRNPNGRPLTLRFFRPARVCTARGWGYPSASSTDIEVIGERCRYVGPQ
jgi:hypothetical protein